MTALLAAAALLACPECGGALHQRDRALRCANGHSFDIARQGYVGLLTGASTKMTGDTAAMLDARAAFQGAGHFAPIAAATAHALRAGATPGDVAAPGYQAATGAELDRTPATPIGATGTDRLTPTDDTDTDRLAPAGDAVLEIGAGTGYYLAGVLDARPGAIGIALDVAKPAARRAARAHPRMASILADAWRGLPVRDAALAGVVSVFAPRNPGEVARVLAPGGRFVVVTPTDRHLGELIDPLGMVRVDPDKDRRLAAALAGTFTRVEHTLVEFPMKLGRADVTHVVAMGPSAFHGTPADDPRIAALPEISEVTASVTVSVYLPNT
ncbi:putative RNA methyltransferase [Nocardia sp. NPDC059177]|uniref:putative RNA methyltransferase n=1 Tax=Nocardia sp. NPDC059177 TaxID=3346759 RepID=UPI0036A85F7C